MPPEGTEGQEGNTGAEGSSGDQNAAGQQGASGNEAPPAALATWEAVVEALPEDQRGMFDEHVRGLRSALETERGQRKDLSKQLRDATDSLEEGSAARDSLEALQEKLDEAEQRADFSEAAVAEGVANPRLAYLAAQQIEAFDRRGNPDWEALKTQFPELFQKPAPPPANAGAGTSSTPAAGQSMNALIRQASGRPG